MLSAPQGKPSASSFLSILAGVSEEESAGSGFMDAGAQAHAEASATSLTGSPLEDAPLRSASGDQEPNGNSYLPPVDRQKPPVEQGSNGNDNAHRADRASSAIASGNRMSASPNATGAPIGSAVPVSSSSVLSPAQTGASGDTFQKLVAHLSEQETSAVASVNPSAQTVTGPSATVPPAGRQEGNSNVSVLRTVGVRGTSTVAPLDKKAATEQKSSAPESGGWTKSASFENVGVQTTQATTSPASMLVSSTATNFIPTATVAILASPSGNIEPRVPNGASVQQVSRNGVMNGSANSYSEAAAVPRMKNLLDDMPLPSSFGNVSADGIALALPVVQQETSQQVQSSAPESSQAAGPASSETANGQAWRGLHDDSSKSVASQTEGSSSPSSPPDESAPSVDTSPQTIAGVSGVDISRSALMDRSEKPQTSETGALLSARATTTRSSSQPRLQAIPSGITFQRTFANALDVQGTGAGLIEAGTKANPDDTRVFTSSSATVNGSFPQSPMQSGASGSAFQRMVESASETEAFEIVGINSSVTTQTSPTTVPVSSLVTIASSSSHPAVQTSPSPGADQGTMPSPSETEAFGRVAINRSAQAQITPTTVSVSSPVTISSSSSRPPVQTNLSVNVFQATFAGAPDVEAAGIGFTEAGTKAPSDGTQVFTSTPASVTSSFSQLPAQPIPIGIASQRIAPNASETKTSGNVVINMSVNTQSSQTSAPVSSPTTIASSSAQPAMQAGPSGDLPQPMIVSSPGNELADTHVEASDTTHAAAQQQAAPSSSVSASGSTRGPAVLRLVDEDKALPEQNAQGQRINAPVEGGSSGVTQAEASRITTNATSVPASTPASVSSPSIQLPEQTTPSSDRTEPMPVSALDAHISENGLTDEEAQMPPNLPSEHIQASAMIGDAPSQSGVQTILPRSAIQPLTSSAAEQDISGNGSTEPRVDADKAIRMTSVQQETPSSSVLEIPSSFSAAALPIAQDAVAQEQIPSRQESGPRTDDETSAASAGAVHVHTVLAAQNVPSQFIAVRSAPDVAASKQIATSQKPLNQPSPPVASSYGTPAAPAAPSARPDNRAGVATPAVEEVFMLPVDSPMAAAATVIENDNQPVGTAAQSAVPSASGSRNPILANTSDAATGKTADAASGSGDTSLHSAQNTPQTLQSSQPDPAHAADMTPRATDSGASLIQTSAQTVPIQTASPETATSHRGLEVPDTATRPSDQQSVPASIHSDSGEVVTASSINTAKLLQTMSQTEMHVGMRSTEFGDISIRTSISQQQMVTQISLDHSDLSQAIAAHVSTMQTKLGENLSLNASIEVHNLGSSLSGETGQSSQRDQGTFSHSPRTEGVPFLPEEETGLSLASAATVGNGNRLDIRA